MVRRRMSRIRKKATHVRDEVKERLVKAFVEKHTPEEVAFSFSLGVFITALPTLGTGVLVFFVLAFLFDRLSKIALFASIVVLNPVVKWGVYGTSYSLGRVLLGPVPGDVSVQEVSLSLGRDVLVRLWLGNLILATVFACIAYVGGLRIVNNFRRRVRDGEVPMVDISPEIVSELSSETNSEITTETNSEIATETNSEIATETNSEITTETNSEITTETNSEIATETNSEISTEAASADE